MLKRKNVGPARYAIYLRCSTDDQKEGDFTTIDAQRAINTAHIASKGGQLVKEYSDEGKTGTNLKRPGWTELLRDAQAGLFDAVCVSYMSRLGRGDAGTVAEYLLSECNIAVEFVKENFTPDMAGFMNKQMTRFVDAMYVENVRQWTKAKMEQMVARGYFCGGQPPFGYRKEIVADAAGFHKGDKEPPKRLAPDPNAAPQVRHAFEIFVETRSVAAVQDYLRQVTPRAWRFDNVTYLLRNEVYRGVLRFGEWVNYTAHEAIISEALWDAAREVDASRTRSPKRNPVEDYPFYLRGLVWCPHCNCRMTPVWGHGRGSVVRYYECIHSKKKLTTCSVRRVNAETLHNSVLGEIERAAKHPTYLRSLITEAVKQLPEPENLTRQLADSSRALRDVERRIARVQEAIEQGGGVLRSLVERLQALETERVTLTAQHQQMEAQAEAQRVRRPDVDEVCRLWGRIVELFEAATDEERQEILQAIVGRVEMTEKETGTCELALLPQVPVSWFELTDQMGAAGRTSPTNPRYHDVPIHVWRGGKNRKKQPRPWQKVSCVPVPMPQEDQN